MKSEELFQYALDANSTLEEALCTLTVPQLQGILFYMHLQEAQSEEREFLIRQICEELPQMVPRFAYCFDTERYALFQTILAQDGILYPVTLEQQKILMLLEMGFAFPALCGQQQVLVVPKEIRSALSQLEPENWKEAAAYNTKLLLRIHGLLYYYGYLETTDLFAFCMPIQEAGALENLYFMELLYAAVLYHRQIEPEASGFRHKRFLNCQYVWQQQGKIRQELAYKRFSAHMLEQAGHPDYMEWIPEMEQLKQFLTEKGGVQEMEAKREVESAWYDFNNGMSLTDVCAYFSDHYFSQSAEQLQEELSTLVLRLFYTMPQWLLKGHSFAELIDLEAVEKDPLEC